MRLICGFSSVILAVILFAVSAEAPAAPAGFTTSTTTSSFVFVPYDKIKGPELGAGQSVMVPYAEFLRLKNTAKEQPEGPDFKPGASLAQASYSGSVDGNVAVLNAELAVEVLARPEDVLVLRLPFAGASADRVEIEGAPATVRPIDDGGGLELVAQGEGRRVVKMRLAVPLQTDGAVRKLDFRVPRAAASNLTLRVPEEVVLETVPDALPATVANPTPGESEITAAAGASDRMMLAYRLKMEPQAAAAEARYMVAEQVLVKLGARTASASVKMNVTFAAGNLKNFSFDLPQGAQLLGVSGSFVKDWSAPDAQGRVVVALIREVSQPFEVSADIKFDQPTTPSQTLTIPQFRVPGAVREAGTITVTPEDGVSVWPEETTGVESVSATGPVGAGARVFRFDQPGWKLVISRKPVQARVRADSIVAYEVTEQFVRIRVISHVTVSGRGIFDLSYDVPEGFEIREAGPPELVAGWRASGRRVEVTLRGEQREAFDLDLRLQRDRKSGDLKLRLEPVSVVGAEEDTGALVLATPVALRATEIASSNLQPTDVRSLMEKLNPLLSQEIVPALGYRYFIPASFAEVSIERQRTRITCETSVLANITPSLMKIDAGVNYNVEFSATDEFQLLLPTRAGEDVRFTGGDIKEKVPSPGGDAAGVTTWTVRLQRKVLGPYRLGFAFDLPLTGTESGKPVRVTVPAIRALNVAREMGFVAVSRGENLEVTVAKSEGLEARDVKELPGNLASASLGFRYFEPEKQLLELDLVRHELETVLGALVRRMHIDTVVNDQREAVHEALFEVQNNREQYLVLKLPEGMEIWSAFVRGVPVRPATRDQDGARLIELTKSESRDDAFRVRLVMRETLGKGAMGMRGGLTFESPEPLNMPVLRATRKLYLPTNYKYSDFGGTMRLVAGGSPPWIEPAADKLLADLPAAIAGGVAQPSLNPPEARADAEYSTVETEAEKAARLQNAGIEVPIVKQGLQFQFSRLSGTGDITIDYWKQKPMVIVQGIIALLLFVVALLWARGGRFPLRAFGITLVLFIVASLTDGFAGRLCAAAFAGAGVALGVSIILYLVASARSARLEAARLRSEMEAAYPYEQWAPPSQTPPEAEQPPPSPPPPAAPPSTTPEPPADPTAKG